MTTNEQQLHILKTEHQQYSKELRELELSLGEEIDYRQMQIIVDEKLPAIRDKLTQIYSDIIYLQEQIAIELKIRRL